MKPVQKLVTIAAAGIFGALFVAPSAAQAPRRPESTLTLTERTEVPGGVILEPGTYVVKVADIQSSWNVVKITNVDDTKTFATVLTTPHTATDSAEHTLFVFYNPPSDTKALRSWWPNNDRWGQDFVYTKQRGEELARVSNEKVPEMTAEMETAMPAPAAPVTIATAEAAPAPPAPVAPVSTTAESTTTTREELPKTASPYPLLALAGAASLALGFAVRRISL